MFIAGRNFMPEAYRGSEVEKMLPVELEPFRETDAEGDRRSSSR